MFIWTSTAPVGGYELTDADEAMMLILDLHQTFPW